MDKRHDVQSVAFADDEMVLTVDGATHRFDLKVVSLRLFQASQTERERYEVSPASTGR